MSGPDSSKKGSKSPKKGSSSSFSGPKIVIWALGAVVLIALGIALTRPAGSVDQQIGPAQLRDLQSKGARVIDVRSAGEFTMGHIAGAENVPVEQIAQTAASWDRSRAYVVYCASGERSAQAVQWMAANGFKKLYDLKGGLSSWDGALTKEQSAPAAQVKTNGKPILIQFFSNT